MGKSNKREESLLWLLSQLFRKRWLRPLTPPSFPVSFQTCGKSNKSSVLPGRIHGKTCVTTIVTIQLSTCWTFTSQTDEFSSPHTQSSEHGKLCVCYFENATEIFIAIVCALTRRRWHLAHGAFSVAAQPLPLLTIEWWQRDKSNLLRCRQKCAKGSQSSMLMFYFIYLSVGFF